MELGVVGKPNVGKSTLFAAATLAPVQIANYPFTTIEANRGVAFVRTRLPHKGDTSVRLDCREGIVGDLDWGESGSGEKGRLANVRFPDDPQLHGSTNVIPQIGRASCRDRG